MNHLQLKEYNGEVVVESPASLVALIYSEKCPHCPVVYDTMSRLMAKQKCNFYLINGEKDMLARKLTDSTPSLIAFKNNRKIDILKPSHGFNEKTLYDFWVKTLNSNMIQNMDRNNMQHQQLQHQQQQQYHQQQPQQQQKQTKEDNSGISDYGYGFPYSRL